MTGELCLQFHNQNINESNPGDRLRLLCYEMLNVHGILNDNAVTCSWHLLNTRTTIATKKDTSRRTDPRREPKNVE